MSSRARILGRLRREHLPFPEVKAPVGYLPMVPTGNGAPDSLRECFIDEAQRAGSMLHLADGPQAATEVVLKLIEGDTAVSIWDEDQIGLPGLHEALEEAGVDRVGQDDSVRVGITGVDSALAATGSLLLTSGPGRYRASSLLPPVHIAIVTVAQILPDLESWWAEQRTAGLERTRQRSNLVVVSGPSRTADIAMQLVMGMHGPRKVHIILIG